LRAQANYNRITLDAGWTKVGIAVATDLLIEA